MSPPLIFSYFLRQDSRQTHQFLTDGILAEASLEELMGGLLKEAGPNAPPGFTV
jgi:hypothetical protein